MQSEPNDMKEHSLVSLLKNRTLKNWRNSTCYHYYEFTGVHSVRRHYDIHNHQYKLIHYCKLDIWKLYGLKKDPNELNYV